MALVASEITHDSGLRFCFDALGNGVHAQAARHFDRRLYEYTVMIAGVALGGRSSLLGPALGVIAVGYGRSALSEQFPTQWTYFQGALFIVVILLLPGGVASKWPRLKSLWPNLRSLWPAKPSSVDLDLDLAHDHDKSEALA